MGLVQSILYMEKQNIIRRGTGWVAEGGVKLLCQRIQRMLLLYSVAIMLIFLQYNGLLTNSLVFRCSYVDVIT